MIDVAINPSGAAFEDAAPEEVARILRRAADKIEAGDVTPGGHAVLFDLNGQNVGSILWEHED